MTQGDFFGAVEDNLRRLAESGLPLPACDLPDGPCGDGGGRLFRRFVRLREFRKLTDRDAAAPVCVRAYDLVSGGIPLFGKWRVRAFAAYSEEATEEGYRRAKFLVRKWYQESGWAGAQSDRPFAGAMVVGSGNAWPKGMSPNADDLPFEQVAFQLLAAPHERAGFGVSGATLGGGDVGAWILRALLPETFEARRRRVADCVERLFRLQDGTVTAERVASATGMPPHDVMRIFCDLQAHGVVTIRRKAIGSLVGARSEAERVYVEPGPDSLWRRLAARRRGAWFAQL